MTPQEKQELVALVVETTQKLNKRQRNDQGRGHPTLGVILDVYMKRAGFSDAELAANIGKNATFINKIRNGVRGMSIETLAALNNELGSGFVNDYLGQLHRLTVDKAFS